MEREQIKPNKQPDGTRRWEATHMKEGMEGKLTNQVVRQDGKEWRGEKWKAAQIQSSYK